LGADLILETVVDALVEQQCEDIAAKLGVVGVAAQDVSGFVQVVLELALGHAPRGAHRDGRLELVEEFVKFHLVSVYAGQLPGATIFGPEVSVPASVLRPDIQGAGPSKRGDP
jgi:hypothetical protein